MEVRFLDEYKYDIFEAILRIRSIEGEFVLISIPIPNKVFEFLRYTDYPYSEPFIDYGLYHRSGIKAREFMVLWLKNFLKRELTHIYKDMEL